MIVDWPVLLTFIPAALALNLTPGADMMFCLGQGLKSGPRAAMAANLGIAAGAFVQTGAAGLGLGAVVAAHPLAFDIIRWLGVAYLVVLAVRTLRQPRVAQDVPSVHTGHAFRTGLAVNLTNPKVILFVLAFVPQFVDPGGAILPQFLVFGLILALGGLVVNGAVGIFAGGIGRRLSTSRGAARWLSRITATIFLGLAARLALIERG